MGVLLGGVPGVAAAHVAIIGAGVVGTHAMQMALGVGARVTVLDKSVDRLRQLDLCRCRICTSDASTFNAFITRWSQTRGLQSLRPGEFLAREPRLPENGEPFSYVAHSD